MLQRALPPGQLHKGTGAVGLLVEADPRGFQPRFLLMLLVCPTRGTSSSKGDMGPHFGGTRTCLACSCLLPKTCQVKAQTSGCIPRASILVCSFRLGFCFLICWIWFYFFNAVVCIFYCAFPPKEVLLEMPL